MVCVRSLNMQTSLLFRYTIIQDHLCCDVRIVKYMHVQFIATLCNPQTRNLYKYQITFDKIPQTFLQGFIAHSEVLYPTVHCYALNIGQFKITSLYILKHFFKVPLNIGKFNIFPIGVMFVSGCCVHCSLLDLHMHGIVQQDNVTLHI